MTLKSFELFALNNLGFGGDFNSLNLGLLGTVTVEEAFEESLGKSSWILNEG